MMPARLQRIVFEASLLAGIGLRDILHKLLAQFETSFARRSFSS